MKMSQSNLRLLSVFSFDRRPELMDVEGEDEGKQGAQHGVRRVKQQLFWDCESLLSPVLFPVLETFIHKLL